MSYDYKTEKPNVFTEEGQIVFLAIRDTVKDLLEIAGSFKMEKAFKNTSGDSWLRLACIDRLVELGELKAVHTNCATQNIVYIKG